MQSVKKQIDIELERGHGEILQKDSFSIRDQGSARSRAQKQQTITMNGYSGVASSRDSVDVLDKDGWTAGNRQHCHLPVRPLVTKREAIWEGMTGYDVRGLLRIMGGSAGTCQCPQLEGRNSSWLS